MKFSALRELSFLLLNCIFKCFFFAFLQLFVTLVRLAHRRNFLSENRLLNLLVHLYLQKVGTLFTLEMPLPKISPTSFPGSLILPPLERWETLGTRLRFLSIAAPGFGVCCRQVYFLTQFLKWSLAMIREKNQQNRQQSAVCCKTRCCVILNSVSGKKSKKLILCVWRGENGYSF